MIKFASQIICTTYKTFDFINTIKWFYFSNTSSKFTINNIVIICSKFSSFFINKQLIFINIIYSIEWIVNKIRFRKNIEILLLLLKRIEIVNFFSIESTINLRHSFQFQKTRLSIIFLVIFLSHFFERLNWRFQIISSSFFFQRRNNIIITSNFTLRNTKNIEFIFKFIAKMIDENTNWQNIEFIQQQWQIFSNFERKHSKQCITKISKCTKIISFNRINWRLWEISLKFRWNRFLWFMIQK